MEKRKINRKWLLFRIIIPAFQEINVFSTIAKKTTALGPIMVATVADKLWGWRVEVIDENNYRRGPKDREGSPDHQILQIENPAAVVGFFCGLSSTMERVWQLAKFYHQQGVITLAGGWHAHYQPRESLQKMIDIVVHGDGESVIQQILMAIEKKGSFSNIPGTSFLESQEVKTSPLKPEAPDLNNLPFPNFNLLKYAKLKIYPIGRIRGCSKRCEFCSVRGKPNWASGQHLFETVKWLVETRKARKFFIVDDRLEEDREGTLNFLELVAQKYGCALDFTVQIRLEAAKDAVLLTALKKAGITAVCIGYESCLDEELRGMRKGYLSSDMIKWTKVFHSFGFFVHGMFIFGYPPLKGKASNISAKERAKRLKGFIRECRLDTVQVLRPIPLAGTDLRVRLEKEGKLFPLAIVPWSKYDGSYVCFQPDDMTLHELQELPTKIMRWFYNPLSFVRIPLKTLACPFDYLIRGWQGWYRGWRNDVAKYGGHLLIKQWLKHYERQSFLKKLEEFASKFQKENSH